MQTQQSPTGACAPPELSATVLPGRGPGAKRGNGAGWLLPRKKGEAKGRFPVSQFSYISSEQRLVLQGLSLPLRDSS